jgi:hypothetical protein
MATLYRFSFEHEIIPDGVSIASGQIWSGFGRFGDTTTALVQSSSTNNAQTAITASLPANTTGVRCSYYTKFTRSGSYPMPLVSVGPFDFNLPNSTTLEIKNGGSQVITQDITELQDNRWNLVRFFADFEPTGTATTASVEFNGINVTWEGATGATSASQVILRGVKGNLSVLDDVGINNSSGSIDADVPGSIRGMVGGMMGNGDVQNWQQNVASLPPTKIPLQFQGNFLYIPKNDLVLSQNSNNTGSLTYSTFTTINAQTSVTRSVWTSSFIVKASVYSAYDHMVYLYGSNGTTLVWHKYNPDTDTIVGGGTFTANQTTDDYTFQTGYCAMSATYSEVNSKILILSSCTSPLQTLQNGHVYASPHIVSHNLKDNSFTLGLFDYGTEWIIAGVTNVIKPSGKIFYNYLDKKAYVYMDQLTGKMVVIDPSTLFYSTNNTVFWGSSAPTLATASFCTCEINNSLFVSSYTYTSQVGEIHQVNLNNKTGSKVISQNQPFAGTHTTRVSYAPGRNAIIATGDAVSYMINPFEAAAGRTTDSIMEYLPQIFNAKDSIYCPKNAAILIASYDAVYNFQGSMEAGVVNALMNLDTLKAGATASGDICTIQIAKPSGSFADGFTYEGMNVRIDNASSLNTASLRLGARDGGVNIPISSSVITWANSQQTAVRSIFTRQNSGSAKWTADEFKNLQFYMEAGPEL